MGADYLVLKHRKNTRSSEKKAPVKWKRIQIIALITFMFVVAAAFIAVGGRVTPETIVSYVGRYRIGSVLILLGLFALKSLTIVVPLASLYLASGILFSPVIAVLVSFLGLTVALTIPWALGRWSGQEGIHYLRERYPKVEKILEYQQENEAFFCFILRIVGGLPCDVLSFYFGACGTGYAGYILSPLGGCVLSLVTVTLLGDVIFDPLSKEFAILIIIRVLISAGAAGLAFWMNRRKKKK